MSHSPAAEIKTGGRSHQTEYDTGDGVCARAPGVAGLHQCYRLETERAECGESAAEPDADQRVHLFRGCHAFDIPVNESEQERTREIDDERPPREAVDVVREQDAGAVARERAERTPDGHDERNHVPSGTACVAISRSRPRPSTMVPATSVADRMNGTAM